MPITQKLSDRNNRKILRSIFRLFLVNLLGIIIPPSSSMTRFVEMKKARKNWVWDVLKCRLWIFVYRSDFADGKFSLEKET